MIIVKISKKLILIFKNIIKFFVKRIPRFIAKPLFLFIISLDDILLKTRIYLFSIFYGKQHKVSKALKDLKTYGVAIIPNFYNEREDGSVILTGYNYFLLFTLMMLVVTFLFIPFAKKFANEKVLLQG